MSDHPATDPQAAEPAAEAAEGPAAGPAADPHAALRAELAGLATEAVEADHEQLDLLDTGGLVAAMHACDRAAVAAVGAAAPRIVQAVDAIAERMRRGGRLVYAGAGTSGRMGVLDASECPPTFGVSPDLVVGLIAGGDTAIRTAVEGAEDDQDAGAADVAALGLGASDSLVGLSASGRTPYVLGALRTAAAAGALTVAVACNTGSRIGAAAEIAIEADTGPELIAGSTRLKAGTAQKLVLNMLSTLTMVRLGKTYGNVMVDLQATNDKLMARAERTVMRVTAVDAATASAALRASGGSVKEAVYALLTGAPAARAHTALAEHDGHLRRALAAAAEGRG
ncbi:N-acetylmuramic acid 6-phosphate etherase [Phaeacidiphilus oryzae]|uniref:N-acetylmuramic acid 6-phosphate etherase n=1 Tax=Phaeacidiphilus oryzae TaxID=348818 RepID=UPI00068E66DF|nr:N-acetylmuramic acid 6-phosphate etherase [Phaeacidiphilus oryzae]